MEKPAQHCKATIPQLKIKKRECVDMLRSHDRMLLPRICCRIRPSILLGFPGGSDGKESACNVGDPGLIPGSERSSGERRGYPLHYSCLENAVGREAWQATIHVATKNQM